MRLTKAWTVASKDFKIFTRKKTVLGSMIGFEVLVGIGMPLLLRNVVARSPGAAESLPQLINAFFFWFVIGIVLLPTGVASYSLVGEKVQKSLEPLLATPTTDDEILAGKTLAAFVPAIAANYVGALVFILLVNAFAYGPLGYRYFPTWSSAVQLLLLAPLACLLSIGYNILVSARSTDVRASQQLGSLIMLPYAAVYVLSVLGVLTLSFQNLLIMSAVVAVLDVVVFVLVKATFRRDEILTAWK